MSRLSALFGLYAGIRCSREKIRAYSLLGRKIIPCSLAQGILSQGLFDAHFGRKRPNSLLSLPAPQGILPSRGAPLPRRKEPRRLRHLDRHDPAGGSSRLQCRI
jgi:hypothetical protein